MSFQKEVFKDISREKKEIEFIEQQIRLIEEKLLDRVPDHFGTRDAVNAFFGALIIGITFILKGATVSTAVGLDLLHTELIIGATLAILFIEIYFIGYSRVKNKSQRKLGQFMTKRLLSLYAITVLISFMLVYLMNLDHSPYVHSFMDVMKIVVVVAFPCSIGAAVPSLLKKY